MKCLLTLKLVSDILLFAVVFNVLAVVYGNLNNEILFSYKMIANNVPVKDISRDWNYFVDWNSILLKLSTHTFHDEFDTCKFRHYLNKNFEKQWPM